MHQQYGFSVLGGSGQTYPYVKPVTRINPADINHSGTVDMENLAILDENWLKGI